MARTAKKHPGSDTEHLFGTILSLRNIQEAHSFFRDLLTEPEIAEFANRWKVARMLAEKVSYKEIEKRSGMSSTTIARIQKWLQKGEGGYQLMIKRMESHSKKK